MEIGSERGDRRWGTVDGRDWRQETGDKRREKGDGRK